MAAAGLLFAIFIAGLCSYASPEKAPFIVEEHLNTMTRYHASLELEGQLPEIKRPSSCKLLHINYVSRHGTRLPTSGVASSIASLAETLSQQASTNGKLPAWMNSFQTPFPEGSTAYGALVDQGREEAESQGQRWKLRFPEVFAKPYNETRVTFLSSMVPRCKATGQAFFRGVYGSTPVKMEADPNVTSILLRFHTFCSKYQEGLRASKVRVVEATRDLYAAVARNLERRLGLVLSNKDVSTLWKLCGFQYALQGDTQMACSLFTPEEGEALEWAQDLSQWLLKAYGDPVNYQMGVPLMKDIVDSMEAAIVRNGSRDGEAARMRFGHAETIMPLSSMLGLFKDRPTNDPRYPLPRPGQKRKWRASLVSPFAANEALLLYKCQHSHRVLALHNERPVVLPGCGRQLYCDFNTFKAKVAGPILKRSFEDVCGGPPISEREEGTKRRSSGSPVQNEDVFEGFEGDGLEEELDLRAALWNRKTLKAQR